MIGEVYSPRRGDWEKSPIRDQRIDNRDSNQQRNDQDNETNEPNNSPSLHSINLVESNHSILIFNQKQEFRN